MLYIGEGVGRVGRVLHQLLLQTRAGPTWQGLRQQQERVAGRGDAVWWFYLYDDVVRYVILYFDINT